MVMPWVLFWALLIFLIELDAERRNCLYKLLQQIRTVLYTVQSDDSGPMGLLPAELKICILKNLCELMSKDSIKNLFHFACTKDTLGMTKEEFIEYMEFVPYEIKGDLNFMISSDINKC